MGQPQQTNGEEKHPSGAPLSSQDLTSAQPEGGWTALTLCGRGPRGRIQDLPAACPAFHHTTPTGFLPWLPSCPEAQPTHKPFLQHSRVKVMVKCLLGMLELCTRQLYKPGNSGEQGERNES